MRPRRQAGPRLLRDAGDAVNPGRSDPDHELAFDAVPLPELLGSILAHVFRPKPRGDVAAERQIVDELGVAFDRGIRIGRLLVLDDHDDPGPASDVHGLHRGVPRREDDLAAVDRVPRRNGVRPAVLSDGGKGGGPVAGAEDE